MFYGMLPTISRGDTIGKSCDFWNRYNQCQLSCNWRHTLLSPISFSCSKMMSAHHGRCPIQQWLYPYASPLLPVFYCLVTSTTRSKPSSGLQEECVHRYEEDLALAKDVGSNAFRFSLEWSKIEPQRGSIDKAAIQRYQQIIRCIRRLALDVLQ